MQAEAVAIADEVKFRPMEDADLGFLLSSWLKSYRRSVDHVPGLIYWRYHRELVVRALERSAVTVACNPEDPSQVFGYVVSEPHGPITVVHFVYVKELFRRNGIASALLERVGAQGCHYTHHTHAGLRLARRFGAHLNPYLVGAL